MTEIAQSVLEKFGIEAKDRVSKVFDGYNVDFREPHERECQKRTAWITVDSFNVSEDIAAGGQLLTITAMFYVTVFYEVSSSQEHYISVLNKRELLVKTLGGAAQAASCYPEQVLATVGNEETLLSNDYFMASTPIELRWEVQSI